MSPRTDLRGIIQPPLFKREQANSAYNYRSFRANSTKINYSLDSLCFAIGWAFRFKTISRDSLGSEARKQQAQHCGWRRRGCSGMKKFLIYLMTFCFHPQHQTFQCIFLISSQDCAGSGENLKVLFARGKLPLYRAAMLSLFNASFKKLLAIILGKISIEISRLFSFVFSESRFLFQNPYFSDGFGTHPSKSAAD